MDGPVQIPQQAPPPPSDLDVIYDLLIGNTFSSYFWLFFVGPPAALAYGLYKNYRSARGWKKYAWIAGAVYLVIHVVAGFLFFFYGLSRKLSFLRGPVDGIIDSLPLVGGWLTRFLNRQILPTPKLWHALLALFLVAAIYAVRRWWRAVPSPEPLRAIESRSAEVTTAETSEAQTAPQPEAVSVTASPPPTSAQPEPALARPGKPCQLFGLTWVFKHGRWTPICPLCQHDMGVMDVQQEGMWAASGGGVTGSFAICSNPACKHQKPLARTKRSIESQLEKTCRENGSAV